MRYYIKIDSLARRLLCARLREYVGAARRFHVELPPMDVYRMVAWLGWVPNILIAAEMLIRRYELVERPRQKVTYLG